MRVSFFLFLLLFFFFSFFFCLVFFFFFVMYCIVFFSQRLVVHCLACKELQDDIHEHLASGCLTDGTPAERAAAADQAQASARDWARNARVWDFKQICGLLPDRDCQVAMVKELLRLGFLIRNQPDLREEAPSTSAGPSTSTAAVVPSGQRKK